jgi:YD repeat-containing protein
VEQVNRYCVIDLINRAYDKIIFYKAQYSRDKLGRITQKTETIEGQTTQNQYEYDLTCRLVSVTVDGVVTKYRYDGNGNRTHVNDIQVASYDNQDRLLQYQDQTYTHTANGEWLTRTQNGQTTRYTYDVLTNLLKVELPTCDKIEYLIDGKDRRIGKKVNSILTQAYLYQGDTNPVAELDANGNIVTQFVYGGRGNVPAYLIKNQQTFRVIADSLGSPK